MTQNTVDFMRKYADLISEAQQPQQLDEGVADMLKPVAQKLGKWLMSKIDPTTAQQLKQAYDQAGGDKDKFMAAIGITQADVAKIAPQPPKGDQPAPAQPATAPKMNEWLSAFDRKDDPLKVKVLNLLANGIPLSGILTLMAGAAGASIPIAWPAIIWYIISVGMFWGIGSYDFRDAVKQPEAKGKAAIDADLAMLNKQYADAQKLANNSKSLADYQEGSRKQNQIRDLRNQLISKYNKNPNGYTSSVTDPTAPTPASQINPVNRNPVAPKQQTDVNGNPI